MQQSVGKNSKTFVCMTDANSTSLSASSAKKFVERKSFLPGKHGGLDVKRISSRVGGGRHMLDWSWPSSSSVAFNCAQQITASTTQRHCTRETLTHVSWAGANTAAGTRSTASCISHPAHACYVCVFTRSRPPSAASKKRAEATHTNTHLPPPPPRTLRLPAATPTDSRTRSAAEERDAGCEALAGPWKKSRRKTESF